MSIHGASGYLLPLQNFPALIEGLFEVSDVGYK